MAKKKKASKESGFIKLLRRIDLCWLVPYMIYTFFVNYTSVFYRYDKLKFNVPFAVAFLCFFVIAGVSVFIYRNYRRDTSNSKWLWIHLSWFIFIPILYNIIIMIASKDLYDTSGEFLAGLDQVLIRIFIIAVCVAALIVFGIGRYVSWKKEEKGKEADPEMVQAIKDYFNVVLLILCFIALVVFGVKAISEMGTSVKEEQHAETVSGFTNEMLDKLPEGCDINTIATDAKMVALITEKRAAGDLNDEQTEETIASKEVFVCSTVSKDVMDKALSSYETFTAESKLGNPFSESYYEYDINLQNHTFTFGFRSSAEIKGINRNCTFVCVYDTEWNLVDAYCMEGILNDPDEE